MAASSTAGLAALLVAMFAVITHGDVLIQDYAMDEYCGETFNVSTEPMKTFILRMRTYSVDLVTSCWMRIQPPPGYLLYIFLGHGVIHGDSSLCENASLRLTSVGKRDNGSTYNDTRTMCANIEDVKVTAALQVLLQYHSDDKDDGFYATVTAYREGRCRSDEFTCANGRCIDSRLKCNYYDNCGDSSNQCRIPSDLDHLWWVFTLIGVFSFLALVAIITTIVCCVRFKKKRKTIDKCSIYSGGGNSAYIAVTDPSPPEKTSQ